MEENFEKHIQERAVLVGLNADLFTKEQTATDETLEELEALLETAEDSAPVRFAEPARPGQPFLHRRGQGPGSEDVGGGYGVHHGGL